MNVPLKVAILEKYGRQYRFADEVGVDEVTLSRIVNGRRELNADERERWAEVLDRPVEVLFPGER
jgi:transcriptional regulator with XRE-family HTH domain